VSKGYVGRSVFFDRLNATIIAPNYRILSIRVEFIAF